jgi:uncharacterized protein YlxP (DUF503 family)
MYIGSLQVRLLVREALSLKDKRRVLRSVKDRLRRTFNAAVAEVDAQDRRQMIVLGIATVSNDAAHAAEQVNEILDWLRRSPAAELVDHQLEVF